VVDASSKLRLGRGRSSLTKETDAIYVSAGSYSHQTRMSMLHGLYDLRPKTPQSPGISHNPSESCASLARMYVRMSHRGLPSHNCRRKEF
jgi:hypothetical protein